MVEDAPLSQPVTGRVKRLVLIASSLAVVGLGYGAWIVTTLPNVDHLVANNPDETALMRERDGERQQLWVPLEQVSDKLVQAVVMGEDAGFFHHEGFDLHEMREAFRRNWEEGRTVRGASTITQQLAKNLFLSSERTYTRKLKEAVLTHRLEKALGKRRILELYLNVIEWGNGVYGVEAAARSVFGKPASDLDAVEAATLAAMIPSPRRLDPCERPKQVRTRRDRILRWMRRAGYLDDDELREALSGEPRLRRCYLANGSRLRATRPLDTTMMTS